jgi:hypothetical protein
VGFHANHMMIINRNVQANKWVKSTHKLGNKSLTTVSEFKGAQAVNKKINGTKITIPLTNIKNFTPNLTMNIS